jgi:uracil-DNA glycosylase
MEKDHGKIHNGAEFDFDPTVVSYWSQWLGHQKPKVLVVGQDFGSVGYFTEPTHRGTDDTESVTNQNLRELLHHAGISVGNPPTFDESAPVFLTNSILCLKEGTMKSAVKTRWVDACAKKHLSPLAEYLRAPIVVSMGSHAWRATRTLFHLSAAPPKITQAAGSSWLAADGTHVFPVCHCGPLGVANRQLSKQVADWQRIGVAVRELGP